MGAWQFTNKLEGMFKDIDLSRDFMTSFRQSKQSDQLAKSEQLRSIEMNMHVLTQGYWPTYPPIEVALPPEISSLQVRLHKCTAVACSQRNAERLAPCGPGQ